RSFQALSLRRGNESRTGCPRNRAGHRPAPTSTTCSSVEKKIPPNTYVYLQRASSGGGVSAPLVHPEPPTTLTSQIRNFEIPNWTSRLTVQFKISGFGFEMQDSSNSKSPIPWGHLPWTLWEEARQFAAANR